MRKLVLICFLMLSVFCFGQNRNTYYELKSYNNKFVDTVTKYLGDDYLFRIIEKPTIDPESVLQVSETCESTYKVSVLSFEENMWYKDTVDLIEYERLIDNHVYHVIDSVLAVLTASNTFYTMTTFGENSTSYEFIYSLNDSLKYCGTDDPETDLLYELSVQIYRLLMSYVKTHELSLFELSERIDSICTHFK